MIFGKSSGGVWSECEREQPGISISNLGPRLIVDSVDGTVHAVGEVGKGFVRIEGNFDSTSRIHRFLTANSVYLARWRNLAIGIVGAALLHYFIVAAGTMLLTPSVMTKPYEFGIQKATLASIGRRGLAVVKMIDLVIISATLFASAWAHFRFLGMDIGFSTRREFVEWLELVYQTVEFGSSQRLTYLQYTIQEIATSFLFDPDDGTLSPKFTVLIAASIDTGSCSVATSRFTGTKVDLGGHPGKWVARDSNHANSTIP